mmetsp:Transcript_18811/g.44198  ORF Transcript_18811/g.44198 Transcript_18811/m.44198 type:complete len:205 (+) Transcript_18811:465-1079(+)
MDRWHGLRPSHRRLPGLAGPCRILAVAAASPSLRIGGGPGGACRGSLVAQRVPAGEVRVQQVAPLHVLRAHCSLLVRAQLPSVPSQTISAAVCFLGQIYPGDLHSAVPHLDEDYRPERLPQALDAVVAWVLLAQLCTRQHRLPCHLRALLPAHGRAERSACAQGAMAVGAGDAWHSAQRRCLLHVGRAVRVTVPAPPTRACSPV